MAYSKESACSAGDQPRLIPGLGRSPGKGSGNPLQYSCLRNPTDRGAWRARVHEVTRVWHNQVTKPPLPPALLHIWNQIAECVWREIPNYSRVQFSQSFMSNSLRPHGLQLTRLPCRSSTPGARSNSCPLSRWCHLTISSSVIPFSSCPRSFPASGSFPMSQFFTSGVQIIGVSAS